MENFGAAIRKRLTKERAEQPDKTDDKREEKSRLIDNVMQEVILKRQVKQIMNKLKGHIQKKFLPKVKIREIVEKGDEIIENDKL